jgi:hypothetical protein
MGGVERSARRGGGRRAGLAGAVVAVVAGSAMLAACSGSSGQAAVAGHLVTVRGTVEGRTLAAWEVAYWQWRASLSRDHAAPSEGSCITAGQKRPVWFVNDDVGRLAEGVHTRTCTIPRGDYVLIGVPSIDCSTIERKPFHAMSDRGLLRCAREDWVASDPRSSVTLDGAAVRSGVFVKTGVFEFGTPARDTIFNVTGYTAGKAAVQGDVTMLAPLTPGGHTIVAELQYKGLSPSRVTYKITVK